jgi:hypothetical protein
VNEARAVALVVWVLAGAPAAAHTGGSTGYASVTVRGNAIRYSLTLSPTGLPPAITEQLQAARAGAAPAAERLLTAVRDRVILTADGARCEPGAAHVVPPVSGGESITLVVDFACSTPVRRLTVRDETFAVFGSDHHTLARIETGGAVQQAALEPSAPEVTVTLAGAPERGAEGGGSFLRLGIEHILTGVDHMLFLAALLLGGGGALALAKTITAFTLAHSVTLALAVGGAVSLPDRVVEPVIAASIAWVAVENLVFRRPRRRWLVSFAFGLVHGFGFAGALAPLALPGAALAWALVGFNVGVEVGQALVIVAVLPILAWARRRGWEPTLVRAGSLALAAIGLAWFVERLFLA